MSRLRDRGGRCDGNGLKDTLAERQRSRPRPHLLRLKTYQPLVGFWDVSFAFSCHLERQGHFIGPCRVLPQRCDLISLAPHVLRCQTSSPVAPNQACVLRSTNKTWDACDPPQFAKPPLPGGEFPIREAASFCHNYSNALGGEPSSRCGSVAHRLVRRKKKDPRLG